MNPRERMLAVAVGVLAALVVGWEFVAAPVVGKARELGARAAAARAAIESEKAVAKRAESIKAKDAQLFKVKNFADVGTVEAAFLGFVRKSAEDCGMKVASERPVNNSHVSAKDKGGYAEIQVALTGEGTLNAFVRFINALATGQRPLRVMQATLSRTDRAGVLAVNMRLSTVAVKEAAK